MKKPLNANGVTGASADPKQWAAWRARWPRCRWGIATGKSGFDVVDIDSEEALWCARELGLDKDGVRQKTPRGWHYLFRANPKARNRVSVSQGVDVRAQGGYIIVYDPSVFKELDVEALDELPEWALPAPKPKQRVTWKSLQYEPATLEGMRLDRIPEIVEGGRNAELLRLAMGICRRRGLTKAIQAAEWLNANKLNPPLDRREFGNIIKSVTRYA